jgi:hypothetical protein
MFATARSRILLVALAAASLAAGSALAQSAEEPWRAPTPDLVAKPRTATSSLEATTPVATPAERKQARTLTTAVFAKPAAAARAAEKVDQALQPDLSAVQPKPEWTTPKGGVGMGEKGMTITTPF